MLSVRSLRSHDKRSAAVAAVPPVAVGGRLPIGRRFGGLVVAAAPAITAVAVAVAIAVAVVGAVFVLVLVLVLVAIAVAWRRGWWRARTSQWAAPRRLLPEIRRP